MSGAPKVDMYVDTKGEWRWTITAGNGEPIAVSSEGYRDKRDCDHSLTLALAALTPDE